MPINPDNVTIEQEMLSLRQRSYSQHPSYQIPKEELKHHEIEEYKQNNELKHSQNLNAKQYNKKAFLNSSSPEIKPMVPLNSNFMPSAIV